MRKLSLETLDIIDPGLYVERGYPHQEWALLRSQAPVFYYQRPNVRTFWAVTRHADIVWVSRQPDLFRSGQYLFVTIDEEGAPPDDAVFLRQLLNMNPPEHGAYRAVVNRRFTPRAVQKLAIQVDQVTAEVIQGVASGTECDFVTEVAAKLPLAVIAEMFGIPRSDWQMMFRLSNAVIAPSDPEFAGSESIQATLERARMEFFEYFSALVETRRKEPRDDVASALANGIVNSDQLPPFELLSYFALLIIAGNETTRNAISGGLYALIEHPEQMALMKENPQMLVNPAVEEILRWTSPVVQFSRVATADADLHGNSIREGDVIAMFYPSANRDEE